MKKKNDAAVQRKYLKNIGEDGEQAGGQDQDDAAKKKYNNKKN